MDQTVINQVEFLLVARAILFMFLFGSIAWVALTTNVQNKVAVKIAGVVAALLCLFNIVLAVEWIILFYT